MYPARAKKEMTASEFTSNRMETSVALALALVMVIHLGRERAQVVEKKICVCIQHVCFPCGSYLIVVEKHPLRLVR